MNIDKRTSGTGSAPEPTEIRLNRVERTLEVDFSDGIKRQFSAELLRVESPSAEVQGHGSGQKKIVPGKRNVGIEGLEPVGNYAILIKFSDGHDTGIFSWDYLYGLGRIQTEVWQGYLDAIEKQGLSRDS